MRNSHASGAAAAHVLVGWALAVTLITTMACVAALAKCAAGMGVDAPRGDADTGGSATSERPADAAAGDEPVACPCRHVVPPQRPVHRMAQPDAHVERQLVLPAKPVRL